MTSQIHSNKEVLSYEDLMESTKASMDIIISEEEIHALALEIFEVA